MIGDELLARCAFPAPGSSLTCAVSGGADSLALLLLAVGAGLDVTAVHVDHGLRAGSAAEADVVAKAAAGAGAAFRSERVAIEDGPDLEARCRAARRAVLPAEAATGHTADDRAETVLLNLLRGSGIDGLAVLAPSARHPIVRLRRAETEAVCAAAGLEPVVDPSNVDPRFRRNRVRHEVLPLLGEVGDRDVVPLLCRLADHAVEESAALEELARDAVPDPTDARAVAAAAPPLARRALRAWLRDVAGGHERYAPDAAAVDRVLAVARGEATSCELPGGGRVARTGQRLRYGPTDVRG